MEKLQVTSKGFQISN